MGMRTFNVVARLISITMAFAACSTRAWTPMSHLEPPASEAAGTVLGSAARPVAPTAAQTPLPTTGFRVVTAGKHHVCALDDDGALYCWGSNAAGQLGDGTRDGRARPARVPGGPWAAASAGGWTTCAIDRGGALYCWGSNAWGNLGLGTTDDALAPARVGDATDWTAVAVGGDHTCALRKGGALYCWGDDTWGQLGDGQTYTQAHLPVHIADGVDQVVAGGHHTCARRAADLLCFGNGELGQLGDGFEGYTVPTQVATGLVDAAAGDTMTCGVRADGSILCFGDGAPSAESMDDAARIALGGTHGCVVRKDGALSCFGDGGLGQLGNGLVASQPTMVTVGMDGWQAVAAGLGFTCALRAGGALYCWGDNTDGVLGRGFADKATPVLVVPAGGTELVAAAGPLAIAAGRDGGCAIGADATLTCWGAGASGQVGHGLFQSEPAPRPVVASSGWQVVAAGREHRCAIDLSGTLSCWGGNTRGQLGFAGEPVAAPRALDGAWVQVAAGGDATCALTAAREIRCFGSNAGGRGAFGTTEPVAIEAEGVFVDVTVGGGQGCAVRDDGVLVCWSDADRAPFEVEGLTGVRRVVAGAAHVCVLESEGNISCFGDNEAGQLGDGSLEPADGAVAIAAADGVRFRSLAAGAGHTCAVDTELGLWCWGRNDGGQLGLGAAGPAVATPTRVGAERFTTVTAGDAHTCARRLDGRVSCWGSNHAGALGDGTAWLTQPALVTR